MATLKDIASFLDKTLKVSEYVDFDGSYNGIQFENTGEIKSVAFAVDCGIAEIKKARSFGANMLIVHHGMLWNAPIPFVGANYRKVKELVIGNMAVYSCHLPLDGNSVFGHNALIAKALKLKVVGGCLDYHGKDLGLVADTPKGGRAELSKRLKKLFPDTFKAFEFGDKNPKKIAISAGSGATSIHHLLEQGTDTLICGELREAHYAFAQDNNLNVYPCGHYATECFGVKALGELVSKKFKIKTTFIQSENPL